LKCRERSGQLVSVNTLTDIESVNHLLTLEGVLNSSTIHKTTGHNALRYEIVQTHEQMLDAIAIRAICFMEEQGIVARQAYDGNDFQATHVVGYDGEEPFAAIRIRWFNGFAKMERMALRKSHRNPRIVKGFAAFALAHVARKGYTVAITHAKPIYARLWRQLMQFEEVTHKERVIFNGHDEPYIELVKHLDVPTNAITVETDATTLFRVEGAWDQQSAFEARE
jgi:hypothetical protein